MQWCETAMTSCPAVAQLTEKELLSQEMYEAKKAVRQAGRAISEIARGYAHKPRHSVHRRVVTDADIQADHILRGHLEKAFPSYAWLSEEHCNDPRRFECKRVWVVDPLDGTRDLVMGNPEYAVSVALIEEGRPMLGVIYNPCTHELFEAVTGGPAKLNGIPIHCTQISLPHPGILASRADLAQGRYARYSHRAQFKPCGSIAYRLACVAAGRAQATLSVTPKYEWDIAAGVLMVTCAGGRVTDLQGQPYSFNRPRPLVNGLIAAAPASYVQVAGMVNVRPAVM